MAQRGSSDPPYQAAICSCIPWRFLLRQSLESVIYTGLYTPHCFRQLFSVAADASQSRLSHPCSSPCCFPPSYFVDPQTYQSRLSNFVPLEWERATSSSWVLAACCCFKGVSMLAKVSNLRLFSPSTSVLTSRQFFGKSHFVWGNTCRDTFAYMENMR